MIKTDLHTHTEYSFDSRETLAELCKFCVGSGIDVVACTEHFDLTPNGGDPYFLSCNAKRVADMALHREEYSGKLVLLNAVEVGQPHVNLKAAAALLSENHFDFVLGAVHNLADGTDVYNIDFKSQAQCHATMSLYLDELLKTATVGDFDSLAHIDFPLRKMGDILTTYTLRPYEDKVREILKVLAHRGKALEVNTRGMLCWYNDVCPPVWVLEAFYEYGGRHITVGSDSHKAQFIGTGLDKATATLKAAGFNSVVYFKDRQPVEMGI